MNASQLVTGEYYAWRRNAPKGRIPLDAQKVRLRHTEQRKRSTMQNRHTIAAITVVEGDNVGREYDVPAREIIAFWDDYEGERDYLLEERRKVQMEQRRHDLRRTVIEALINYRFQERELPFVVKVPYGMAQEAYVSTDALMNYLEITEDQIKQAIDRAMEKEFGG